MARNNSQFIPQSAQKWRTGFGTPFLFICMELQNDEGTAAGGNFNRAGRNLLAAQAGQSVAFAQNQVAAVQSHDTAAQTVLAGQNVSLGIFGQFHGGQQNLYPPVPHHGHRFSDGQLPQHFVQLLQGG